MSIDAYLLGEMNELVRIYTMPYYKKTIGKELPIRVIRLFARKTP